MSQLATEHADAGLIVLAVNVWDEDKRQIERFVRKEKLAQRFLLNGSKVANSYKYPGVPTLLWIDGAGIVKDVECDFGGPASLARRTDQLLRSSGKN
ncbi:MAG: hypothetical protein IH987_00145 [Planctomycetes bacterium]|nr:hypothetical protein [Planctomycetota bacterium]